MFTEPHLKTHRVERILESCMYFEELFDKSNRALFPCLQSLILKLTGLREFSKVMQTRDRVELCKPET